MRTGEISGTIFQLWVMYTCLCISYGCNLDLGTINGTEGQSGEFSFYVESDFIYWNPYQVNRTFMVKNEADDVLVSFTVYNDNIFDFEKSSRIYFPPSNFYIFLRRRRVKFTLEDLTLQDTGKYSLYSGNIEECCVQLSVIVPLRNVTVSFTVVNTSKTLTSLEVAEYGQVEFTCTTSPSSAPASITWYIEHPPYDVNSSLELTTPKRRALINAGYKDLLIITEEETTVTFNKNMSRARISCQAEDGENNETAYTPIFTVVYGPNITDIAQPGVLDVLDTLSLTCDVDGVPEPTVSWTKGSLMSSNRLAPVSSNRGFELMNAKCEDMDNYICFAENKMGSSAKSVEVLVKCPPRENPNAPHVPIQYGRLNSPVNLIIHVLSYRLPTFRWMIKGSGGTLESITGRTVSQTDLGRSSKLRIEKLEKFGTYVVQVSNGILPDTEFEFNIKEVEPSQLTSSSDTVETSTMISIVVALAGAFVFAVAVATVLRYKHKINVCRRTTTDGVYESRNPGSVDDHLYSEASPGAENISMQPAGPGTSADETEVYQNV